MFKEKLRNFLVGRYGGDSLNTAISGFSLVSFITAIIVTSAAKTLAGRIIGGVLYFVAFASLGLTIFRTFSKNLTARRAEYEWFRSHIIVPFTKRKNAAMSRRIQKATHKFFKCPECRQTVRVPKGKGKIRITCPKCGKVFIKKT